MDHKRQLEVLDEFFAMKDARTTPMADAVYRNPASDYLDPDQTAREVERLFKTMPQLVAFSTDIPTPGAYVTFEIAGVPYLLVRGEDGDARCFVNACRHRGCPIADGSGETKRTFTCPYHAWVYDLHGGLVGMPLARDGFAELTPEEFGLLSVPAREQDGFLFMHPAGEDFEIDEWLAGMAADLAPLGAADHVPLERETFTLDVNWKLALDTFLELYHVFSLHKDSLSPFLLSTPTPTHTFGPHGRVIGLNRNVKELEERPREEWSVVDRSIMIHLVFPNAILVHMYDHFELWRFSPIDGRPDQTAIELAFYVPRDRVDETEYFQKNWGLTVEIVFTEDFPRTRQIHRSLAAGSLPEVVFGRNEPALSHFHAQIAQALA